MIKEEKIRPKAIFDKYLDLSKKDIKKFFRSGKKKYSKCPACKNSGKKIFSKFGFDYDICKNCETIYNNPRYAKDKFDKYYISGKASKYWSTIFYAKTSKARKFLLWKPTSRLLNL